MKRVHFALPMPEFLGSPKKLTSVLLVLCLVFIGYILGANWSRIRTAFPGSIVTNAADEISVGQLKSMLKNKKFTLINVHTPYAGEIEKTNTFIAYDQIVANSASLPKDKNTPIILYCKSGNMSVQALATVRKLGYTDVKHLAGGMDAWHAQGGTLVDLSNITTDVLPQAGYEMPIAWGDIGPKLIASGVIDLAKFKAAVKLTPEQEDILVKGSDKNIKIDSSNVQFVVDMLWALGLAQKSVVYDQGPMGGQYKTQVANFSSTGGWTLGAGNAMQYYNGSDFIKLTPEQQQKVAEIAKNVYRPCCGNSTYFPDCNHGMAALAMIELMVANNVNEKTIYKKLLGFNSFWFSDTYVTTAVYFARQGIAWKDVDAKTVMGEKYSSGQGASTIAVEVGDLPWKAKSGSSCGA